MINVLPCFVDQAVSQKEGLHAKALRDHVLPYIIAHHQAIRAVQSYFLQNLTVIVRIWLAEMRIFVGGDQLKIVGLQPRPVDTAVGGNGGKQGVCGKNQPQAHGLDFTDGLGGCRMKAAAVLCFLEFGAVEFLKQGQVLLGVPADNGIEDLPEHILVFRLAVVFHHGPGTGPESLYERLGFVAMGGKKRRDASHVVLDEHLLIHGKQGAVQIE